MTKSIKIPTSDDFNFRNTVYSHGWSELHPFELDEKEWVLSYVFTNADKKRSTFASVKAEQNDLIINIEDEEIVKPFQEKIISEFKRILRLGEDLTGFYDLTREKEDLRWIGTTNAGRLIRSPTVFEDLVKTICTTNCSWSLTRTMTKNLVDLLGIPSANGKRSFPTAETMAQQDESFYRTEIRAGYRSPYFVELANSVAGGKIDPESWLDSGLETKALKQQMKSIKGVGDYAAENLLKLVGRYDGLALDSWLRSQFYKKHNGGEVCDDKVIRSYYDDFGRWRGLAIWCDMTERFLKDSD